MGLLRRSVRRADRQRTVTKPGAQFEILVDGTPGSYRDRKNIAIASAEFLKHRTPQSEVKVKDLQSGEVIVVTYKPET